MTVFALALVLAAAFMHATWNLLAKRAGGGPAFVWLCGVLSSALYAPFAAALLLIQRPRLGAPEFLFMSGSAVLHLGYFLMLQQGYRTGDLSLVYPLARGTGPLLSTAAAIAFFGEWPTPPAIGGALLIAGGVFVLGGGTSTLRDASARRGSAYALLTGTLIAAYTLWDKHAVSVLLIPPLLLDWGANVGRAMLLTPFTLRRWDKVRGEWWLHRREAFGVAVLTPLAYILVLTALVFTPVSYIAPAREISILIGTLLGTRLLAEGDAGRRLTAAGAMVLGIVALALG